MFDKPSRINIARIMAKEFDSQSFFPGSRPGVGMKGERYWWFPTIMNQLYSTSVIFNGTLDVETV